MTRWAKGVDFSVCWLPARASGRKCVREDDGNDGAPKREAQMAGKTLGPIREPGSVCTCCFAADTALQPGT